MLEKREKEKLNFLLVKKQRIKKVSSSSSLSQIYFVLASSFSSFSPTANENWLEMREETRINIHRTGGEVVSLAAKNFLVTRQLSIIVIQHFYGKVESFLLSSHKNANTTMYLEIQLSKLYHVCTILQKLKVGMGPCYSLIPTTDRAINCQKNSFHSVTHLKRCLARKSGGLGSSCSSHFSCLLSERH